jgi:hypothetical protein
MCRNIKTHYNYSPQATQAEVNAAALQYVRNVSGTTKPFRRRRTGLTATVFSRERLVCRGR